MSQEETTTPPLYDYAAMVPTRRARKGEATEAGAHLYGCTRCNNSVFVTSEAHRSRRWIKCGQCAKERANG